jgi:hypothetical protein
MNQRYFVAISLLWAASLSGAELLQLNHQLELLAPVSHKYQSFSNLSQSSLRLLLEKIWPIIKPRGPFDQYKLEHKEVLEKINEYSETLKQDYADFQAASNVEKRERLDQKIKQLIGSLPVSKVLAAILGFQVDVYGEQTYGTALYTSINKLEQTLFTKEAYKELNERGGLSHKIPQNLLNMIVDNGASYQFTQQIREKINEIRSLYRMLDTKGAEYVRLCQEFLKEKPVK